MAKKVALRESQSNRFTSTSRTDRHSRSRIQTISETTKFKNGTPSTIATASTNDMTIQSSFMLSKENNNGDRMMISSSSSITGIHTDDEDSKVQNQNTKDILARWKREKLEQQDRAMKDISNKPRSRDSQKETIESKSKSIHSLDYRGNQGGNFEMAGNHDNYVLEKNNRLESAASDQQNHQRQVHSLHTTTTNEGKRYQHSQDREEEGDDDMTSQGDNDTIDHSSSVMTTPTTNTALNQVGLDRIIHRNKVDHKSGVRLFSNSHGGSNGGTMANMPSLIAGKKDNSYSSSSQSSDVSLITQDTDPVLNIQNADIDAIMEQVDEEKSTRRNRHLFHHESYNAATSSTHHHNQQLSFVKHKERNGNNRSGLITSTSDSKCNNVNENVLRKLQSKFNKCKVTLQEQDERIAQQNNELSRLSADNSNLVHELEKYHSTVSRNVILFSQQLHNLQLKLGYDKEQVEVEHPQSMDEMLDILKGLSGEDLPSLIENVSSAREELRKVQTTLNEKEKQLEGTLSVLHASQQEEEKHRLTVTSLTESIALKQTELSEIQYLCDERVQSAHEVERKTNLLISESNNKKAEIKLMERELRLQKEEFENDRIGWETQIQSKQEELEKKAHDVEEDRKEIILLSESLDSNRDELETQRKHIASVKNKLLEMEANCEEKQHDLARKESEIDKKELDFDRQQNNIRVAEDELRHSYIALEEDREKFGEEHKQFIERKTAFEEEKKGFEDEYDKFTERVSEFEKNEADMKKHFNKKVSKLKMTVKQSKEDANREKNELNTLREKLKRKEKDLNQRVKTCLQEESRISKMYDDLESQKRQLEDDRLKLEHSHVKHKKEEVLLDEMVKKREAAEKSLNSINFETIKVRETIANEVQTAQSELLVLRKESDSKKYELELYEEKVSQL